MSVPLAKALPVKMGSNKITKFRVHAEAQTLFQIGNLFVIHATI
jgi:hypothetical protein